ncbi:MAG: hypothetical protein ACE5GW_00915 [Planctomycetota bacterium]
MSSKLILAAVVVLGGLGVALAITPALASLGLVETSTKTKGATTITWESSFADFDYTLGDTINMTVNWTVDAGVAEYDSFNLKRYTPRGRDPATGTDPTVTYPGSNGDTSVDVSFSYTGMHYDDERNVEIGNAHFKLKLKIDKDGDGEVENKAAGYGVNVHAEDPQ